MVVVKNTDLKLLDYFHQIKFLCLGVKRIDVIIRSTLFLANLVRGSKGTHDFVTDN